MGVNAVVVVENSRHRTPDEFKESILQDRDLGPLVWNALNSITEPPWEEFEWQGKKYFSWTVTPRVAYLNLYREEDEAPTPVQITFFRCMLLVERAAGGPIYVGNDVVNYRTPSDFPEEGFWLPPRLDSLWSNWREIAQLDVRKLSLIF